MIRIPVVDSHRLFRMGLRKMLPEANGFNVVAEPESGEQAVDLARELMPHVVLMDILMPGIGGLEATVRIRRMNPDVRVIALTACETNPFPVQTLRAGAIGYLTKGVHQDELRLAIRKVHAGRRYVCSEIAQQLAIEAFDTEQGSPFNRLSGREMQIMLMVINCRKVNDISENPHLSPKTVNSCGHRTFEKPGVSSDVELTLPAVGYGLIRPEASGFAEVG